MGIGFVIIFWAIIGSIVLASYLLLSHLGKKSSRALLVKKVLVAFVAAVVIPIALWFVINFARGSFPSHVFESSFAFAPTSDVVELEGEKSTFGDSGSTYLRFRANKQTFERITGLRFVEIDEKRFRSQSTAALKSAPSYWRPFEGEALHFYEAYKFDESFAFSNAVLSYDESSYVVHFYWIGID
ncbi:MAG: hypothetical protein H0U54_14360 [Acidobacteria bacterium]|nr:hypothetical protein [Acidobacteriota bacterium]